MGFFLEQRTSSLSQLSAAADLGPAEEELPLFVFLAGLGL